MITIVVKSKLKPGVKEEYLKLLTELVQLTRTEDGCICYDVFEDVKDPLVLTLIEKWRDQESIDAHSSTETFLRIVPELRKMRESTEMTYYKQIL